MRFDTVLVANRGEIAVRVIRTIRAEGYRAVAVYSDADSGEPHVGAADVAVRIGPASAAQSYLDSTRIIDAALRSGAQAIHPGYGFLSENADFAQACTEAGLVFIGPTAEAIRVMGDKAAAKRLMVEAGVPLLLGYQEQDQSDERMRAEAEHIGLPLMVKAAAGGGGKGMRLVTAMDQFAVALGDARREALAAFGSDVLILERALLRPRHVEIQVLADEHGHVISLGERDCSIQRRHQKIVEESPSPAVDPRLRREMSEAAVAAAKRIDYRGAGTVEFLLDSDGSFAFLEMNTRLQVEHPVTEMVTGHDLVAWQLRIAQGEPLTISQDEVEMSGHAIEVRLYAEDPVNGYLPASGPVLKWIPPTGRGIRVDGGIATGSTVGTQYDPMIAKIIAHGRDRDEARTRLISALQRTTLLGLTTNRAFLTAVLRHEGFAAGEATTAFLTEASIETTTTPSPEQLAIAAGCLHQARERAADRRSPGLAGWTNAAAQHCTQHLAVGTTVVEAHLTRTTTGLDIDLGGSSHHAQFTDNKLVIDGVNPDIDVVQPTPDRVLLRFPLLDLDVRDIMLAPPDPLGTNGSGILIAPMHGSVTAVFAAVGDHVGAGDRLLVLEAMKMEHPLAADITGHIAEIVTPGTQVSAAEILVRIVAGNHEVAA